MSNTDESLEPTGTTGETQGTVSTKSTKSRIPQKDIDLQNVCLQVSVKWQSDTNLTLLWTTQTDFMNTILDYKNDLNARYNAGGSRPGITKQLIQLDAEINDKLSFVKGYIQEKYGKKSATSYYSQLGIVKSSNGYQIPTDRDSRLKSLTMMLTGIKSLGLSNMTYGIKYWTDILNKYEALKTTAASTDSTIANKVGSKNELKKELKKTLTSLILLIRANYPDTWKAELRSWGFQKEKY